MKFTPESAAVATVLAVVGLTFILASAVRLSTRLATTENMASEALDTATNNDNRLSVVEGAIGDLSDIAEDHDDRLDSVESEQLMRSW